MSQGERSFLVGETVYLRVRVSEPGTKKPTDPETIAVTSFKRDGNTVALTDPTFDRLAQGDWTLTIPTVGLSPGTYTLVVTISSGTSKVVKIPDQFVLHS